MLTGIVAFVAFFLARKRAFFPILVVFAAGAEEFTTVDPSSMFTASKLGMAAAVAAFVAWHRPVWPPIILAGRLLLIMVAYMCASIVWSYYPGETMIRVVTYLMLTVLYATIVLFVRDGRDVRGFWHGFILYGMVDGSTALYRLFTGNIFVESETGVRVAGIAGTPNQTSFIAGIALTLVAASIAIPQRERPWYALGYARIALYGFFLAVIVSSGSRTGFIAAFAGVSLVVLQVGRVRGPQKGIVRHFWPLVVAILIVSYTMVTSLTSLSSRFGGIVEDRLGGRMDIYVYFLGLVKDAPLIGHGLNTSNSLAYADWAISWATHNTLINILVEFGIIGILLFAALIYGIIRTLRRIPKFDKDSPAVLDGMILKALCLQFAISAMAADQLQDKLTWVALALLDAVYSLVVRSTIGQPPRSGRFLRRAAWRNAPAHHFRPATGAHPPGE